MKQLYIVPFFGLVILVCILGALFFSLLGESWDWPSDEQIGYTYTELRIMKAECEKNLPRSTECSIVVYYLPQAELEEVE